ncbi:hypothetical protein BDA96_04G219300 [Sorghum bicolor]|uniref:Uncharacterized protein n=2 Tax=Sorghum bicolor TaxID=4558 RepID=A0A921R7Q2_SORBI|nr:hypothetical protein BDA96_04G219300 [Sorghum bicolor]OQU85260.1 hypothetical protein SORBI_3004G205900 [Sorghum bicolor]
MHWTVRGYNDIMVNIVQVQATDIRMVNIVQVQATEKAVRLESHITIHNYTSIKDMNTFYKNYISSLLVAFVGFHLT